MVLCIERGLAGRLGPLPRSAFTVEFESDRVYATHAVELALKQSNLRENRRVDPGVDLEGKWGISPS